MATFSTSSVDWIQGIKPLISASYSSFNKDDVGKLVENIIKSEAEILEHDDKYETFYSLLVALSAHYLTTVAAQIGKYSGSRIGQACEVLIRFLLKRIKLQCQNSNIVHISQGHMMVLIQSLCTGKIGLTKSDVLTFTALLKSAAAPPAGKSGSDATEELQAEGTDSDGSHQRNKESHILDHMMAILDEAPSATQHLDLTSTPTSNKDADLAFDRISASPADKALKAFSDRNIQILQSLGGSEFLLDLCEHLVFLKRHMAHSQDALKEHTHCLPATQSDASFIRNSFQSLLSDITIVWRIMSLPIHEPLMPARLQKIITLVVTCLYAAVTVVTANTVVALCGTAQTKVTTSAKDDEADNFASSIVEKSLEIYNSAVHAMRVSSRAGGQAAQNAATLGAWVILTGLKHMLAISATITNVDKVKERSKASSSDSASPHLDVTVAPTRPASSKTSTAFSGLTAALASHAIGLLNNLMADIRLDTNQYEATKAASSEVKVIDMFHEYSARQRITWLTKQLPLMDFLFTLLTSTVRKALSLKKQKNVNTSAGDHDDISSTGSASDSTTYYEDDFSSSDDSSADDDDDSEPIFGQWFEEPITGQEAAAEAQSAATERLDDSSSEKVKTQNLTSPATLTLMPDKKDLEVFVHVASDVLQLITEHFLCSSDTQVIDYVRSNLGEQHMPSIAAILRDIDKEHFRLHQDKHFGEFSAMLVHFCHNFITSGLVSESLQDVLLSNLGVDIHCSGAWPLNVQPRTLALLAEILLLRLQKERSVMQSSPQVQAKSETSVMNIWQRFLKTLCDSIQKYTTTLDPPYDDVNVEHLQLLIFLYHSLHLWQRKTILLEVASCIISVTENLDKKLSEVISLPLSRLLLLFEYLIHHYYDLKDQLLHQVRWNLFGAPASPGYSGKDESVTKSHFPFHEVENRYQKNMQPSQHSKDTSMKPRFYNLAAIDFNNQDAPKIDGLACRFLLGNPDSISYDTLYDACVKMLSVASCCSKEMSHLDACSAQYHFILALRILECLPPSARYLKMLESGSLPSADVYLLHTLRWLPRVAHKTFNPWVKDGLLMQKIWTEKAESIVTTVEQLTTSITYDVRLAIQIMQDQISAVQLSDTGEQAPGSRLPSLWRILLLDAVVAKVHVTLDDIFTKTVPDSTQKSLDVANELIPATFQLIQVYAALIRSNIMNQVQPNDQSPVTPEALKMYSIILKVGSTQAEKLCPFGSAVMDLLPGPVKIILDKWNNSTANEFPRVGAWRNAFANDIIPSEGYIDAIQSAHMASLSSQPNFALGSSLKHVLQALVRLVGDLIMWFPNPVNVEQVKKILLPLALDASSECISEAVTTCMEHINMPVDGDDFHTQALSYILDCSHQLLMTHAAPKSGVDERIVLECVNFMETLLDKPVSKNALAQFYTTKYDLVSVLLSTASDHLSLMYSTKVLKFFNRLFELMEKNPSDHTYQLLCMSVSKLAKIDVVTLQGWLSKMIMTSGQSLKDTTKLVENRQLLQSLTGYIVKENSFIGEEVATAILNSLVPMGSELLSSTSDGVGFSELMVVMATLAGSGTGSGHLCLFEAAVGWLEQCKSFIVQKNVLEKLQENVTEGKHQVMVEACCYIISYIGEILGSLKHTSDRHGSSLPIYDGDIQTQEQESDWIEDLEQEDEESGAEDSDEESLNNKLCTFTITQKEFMNQHWYHCHTCKMVDGVGVCTVCAHVCHKDHELSYAKYGSFFCDCGAKEDGSCQALVRRSTHSGLDQSGPGASVSTPSFSDTIPSSLHRHLSTSNAEKSVDHAKSGARVSKCRDHLGKQLQKHKDTLLRSLEKTNTVNTILELLHSLMPPILEHYNRTSPLNVSSRVNNAIKELHLLSKNLETTDQLMTATLGSQEGAFENVRMSYNGDQGQTIRQLITSHVLRRVAMCCLISPHGKRQHLAVTHEKGKITILQLSALLKQADSSKRKLTLTRLSSAPVPFTVLNIVGNPCNEDVLAVCGLKDCHVLTLTGSGTVNDRLVLHPALDTGNFIIKAVWLPGSQTELALVTADFVKVYNLAKDAISPQYYFLLPSGKVRDATFIFTEESKHLVLMASTGFLYAQTMEEQSSAKHGPFYITNILEIRHAAPDMKESYGQVGGGGVSVYFSHSLQLLFYSYAQGKTFISPVGKKLECITTAFQVIYKSSNGGKSCTGPQPLVQWSEVAGHPGLITSMTQTTSNPVILMVKPDSIQIQEIKVLPAKAKIQDMVAIRHAGSNAEQRTTLILLCEDGSLRIYMANTETTGYWLSPLLQPYPAITALKPVRKKKTSKIDRPTGTFTFPIDFFEHCQLCTDIEYGGNDVLQVYNVQQIKHRLNTTGMYIACTKPVGFNLEVTNTNASQVIVGLRVLVGTQAIERAPSYLEMFGRSVQINISRARWYDIPFSREESLTADKKVTLFVGASVDPAGVTVIDSVKVYTKTKDSFGWPEDSEELSESSGSKVSTASASLCNGMDSDGPLAMQLPLTAYDKLVASSLEVLDGCFAISSEDKTFNKTASLEIVTGLLTLPTPNSVQQHAKTLMASLHSSRQAYYSHKDQAVLQYVLQILKNEKDVIDAYAFQHLLILIRAISISRPTNLVQYGSDNASGKEQAESSVLEVTDIENEDEQISLSSHLMEQLMEVFWRLHDCCPQNPSLAPLGALGLSHIDITVAALVEILHAFSACDADYIDKTAKHYVKLLLCKDVTVSFACKQALIRILRPRQCKRHVVIPSPPRCSTPGAGAKAEDTDSGKSYSGEATQPATAPNLPPSAPDNLSDRGEPVEGEGVEQIEQAMAQPSPLEALLAGGSQFPPMLDIPPDADDETMVELAIALSLQEQQGDESLEAGTYSDTTASAPGSDDEVGSTAATDGSTLRTSPAEQVGSAGSESGSVLDSDHNASGRSSAYGDALTENTALGHHSENAGLNLPSSDMHHEVDTQYTNLDSGIKLHSLRLSLLGKLMMHLSEVCTVDGVRAIPFMQVLLILISDLDSEEKDKASLDKLLTSLLAELDLSQTAVSSVKDRTSHGEVQLVILRLVSVLMSRTKAVTKPSESTSLLSTSTASALLGSGVIEYCLAVLKNLESYWKTVSLEKDNTGLSGQLLKPHRSTPIPDMSPFFLRQYVKGHAGDIFQAYPQLLTEMVLRLPYQIKKIAESTSGMVPPTFDQAWFHCLCEYLMMQQTTFVKRQVRRLLQFLCGSKERYRQLRDLHALETHVSTLQQLSSEAGLDKAYNNRQVNLSYNMLIALIEQLKACADIAVTRTLNWQRFCLKDDSILTFLVHAAIVLDEGMAPVILQLLQCALCGVKSADAAQTSSVAAASPSRQKKEKSKAKTEGDSSEAQKHDESLCAALTQQMLNSVPQEMLSSFIQTFLLSSNSTAVRWQAHALILHIYRNSAHNQQEILLDMMWTLWSSLSSHGRKAPQFVDLLGYFTLKTPLSSEKKMKQYVQGVINMLRTQNQILSNHCNTTIYSQLQGLVEFDGYYLESDPCFVCNNPEVSYGNIKLSAIKVDSRFTTNTQIVKLVGSHNITSITIRISDIKRTKMVRTINFYYNNRSVQAVVELKNKPGLWHKAKKVTLSAGQTEVKVEFPLPIVACNLLIEYADFCDNLNASAETLQCPRCSAAVPANPGVCSNCGENVFQCHKCRSINYDEKDPFLCNACGFCKYAKFEYTLTAKQCCAVDPIENDEDRKKAVSTINSLLEKADRLYRQLQLHKTTLEGLLIRISENNMDKAAEEGQGGNTPVVTVRKCIQQLAQRYCGDCKATFDELSKVIQRVVVSRQELVQYDRQQRKAVMAELTKGSKQSAQTASKSDVKLSSAYEVLSSSNLPAYRSHSQCYGCASSVVEHCTTLLRALASHANIRQILCSEGLLQDLVDYNLRPTVPSDIRHLLYMLTKDNAVATEVLNTLLMKRIGVALRTHNTSSGLSRAVQHDMLLLAYMVHRDDSCWEQRLQCVVKLLLKAMKLQGPVITETITLPCLRMLQHIMKPVAPSSKKYKDKTVDNLTSVSTSLPELHVNFNQWLSGEGEAAFRSWKNGMPSKGFELISYKKKEDRTRDRDIERHITRVKYLIEKYGTRWRMKTLQRSRMGVNLDLQLSNATWLCKILFCPWSQAARQVACNLVETICQHPARCLKVLDMLTENLDELGKNGEDAMEFLTLYKKLIAPSYCKYYLALKGIMPKIGNLITQEIEQLAVLEETTLTSDLSQGFALKALTELLAQFVEHENIKRHYKNCLVGVVLNGYLSLRKLLVQRTKLIDATQDKLLELLEELTTGTESETRDFMAVCVDTVKKYGLDDFRSPVFIFERLCSIIYPEENDVGEFFMSLEKDPQQEDFLQGRMLGNPYSSLEPGLGPLMRDVKNKICQDCELVALLEDDTGMEILVCNKIISLDLPVKEVYKKIWVAEHGEGEAMRMVYRMRGLLGDATEDMVNSLDSAKAEDVDNEEVYKMASVMAECGGLSVMLQRLAAVGNLATGRTLLTVLLKLFSYCVKVKVNRQALIKPEMNTINIMLGALNLALLAEQESGSSSKGQTLTEQILQIMETILLEVSSDPPEEYREFSKLCGDSEQLMMLLDRINSTFVRANSSVLQALMRLIPFLAFGDEQKMMTLINHFKPYCDFNRYDVEHTEDDKVHLDCFCVIADGIEQNANGQRLKDMILQEGIVQDALSYMKTHAPVVKTLLATDSEDWKEFITKPALRYVLRILSGLSKGHENTQIQVGKDMIPILHKLEQVSSDEHVGTAAENLMEALRGNAAVAAKIEEVRQETKLEKKKLAMAMRQKQLGALGMTTNDKGQVTVKSPTIQHMEELKEEMGLTCCICREGYRYQPSKVLAIYTYTTRLDLDDFEAKHRKMQGYSTVSHFNIVHVDCHLAAVRHARGREEWQSAELQNANTKCNGLLPLWGPQVPESAFATCLARHNTYLQECTGLRDTSYSYTIHDLKLLLLRFAQEKSFSEQSGGGGRQSNMHLVPYLMHMAVYVMNTTRSVSREEKNLQIFLDTPPEKWIENIFEVDGPLYWLVMSVHICNKEKWHENGVQLLRRLLAMAHVRHVSPAGPAKLTDRAVKAFAVYRTPLLLYAIVNGLYKFLYKKVTVASDSNWALSLAEYIRHNDSALLEEGDKLVKNFEVEVLPCESFAEYCDVIVLEEIHGPLGIKWLELINLVQVAEYVCKDYGMLEEIPNPDNFIRETLARIP